MNRCRAAMSLVALCALGSSAIAVATASADTAAKCEASGTEGTFKDAHCLEALSPTGNGFKHTTLANNTPTAITVTNANTLSGTSAASTAKLRGVLVGNEAEVQCTAVGGNGSIENREGGPEMWAEGTVEITYTGCSVTKPAGKNCFVAKNEFKTTKLFLTTQGLTKQIQIEPAMPGADFASVTIEKCTVAALNKAWPVTGSLIVNTSGATASTTHVAVTTLNTLKWGGQKAGLDGSITIKAGSSGLVTT